jgi:hypothetical protein
MIYSTRHTIEEGKWDTMAKVYNETAASP